MTNQDLNELILNPSMLPLVDTQELQDMAEKFPYFQNIRFLAVKKHLLIQSPQYEKYLNTAASYSSDRKFLYDYLYEIELNSLPTGNLDGLHEEDIDFEIITHQNYEEEEEEEYDDFEDVGHAVDEEGEETEHSMSDDNEVGEAPSIEDDVNSRLHDILVKVGEIPPDRNLKEAISRIRNMRLGNSVKDEKQPELTEEEKIFHFDTNIEELEDGGLENKDLLGGFPETFISEQTSFTFLEIDDYEEEEEDDTYIEELKLAMRKKHIERLRKSVEAFFKLDNEMRAPEEEEQIIGEIPDDISFKEWMKSLKKNYERNDFPVHQSRIEEQIANSIEEDDNLMSEELAKLLASQGNKERAIEMYEHLILKFPEKKAFFALKIRDLNQ